MDAPVLTLVPMGEVLKVVKESEGWVKVLINANDTGYVSSEYVDLSTEFEEAVSIKEEQDRLEAEDAASASSEQTQAVKKSNNTQTTSAKFTSNKASTAGTSSLRNNIVEYALQFAGNSYVWGGTSLTNGADCSGYTQSVFRDNGISIPRTSRSQASSGRSVSVDNMKPGDLIFYDRNGSINHVAIYIGNGEVISASNPTYGIRITSYNYRQPYKVVSYIE